MNALHEDDCSGAGLMPSRSKVRETIVRPTRWPRSPTALLALRGQPSALIIRESEPSATNEDSVLLDEVHDRALLLATNPAHDGQKERSQR